MTFYGKLIVALALVSGIAAGLLSYTYKITAPTIEQRGIEEQAKALQNVFFLQAEKDGNQTRFLLRPEPFADGVTALFTEDNPDTPAYYAAIGQAVGYNSGVPVSLMVGFTGAAADAASLLAGYVDANGLPAAGDKGEYIVGFSVVNSEETPGLGERIKDARPPFTWAQLVSGNRPPESPDKATPFQKQFRAYKAENLVLKKNGGDLDAITASTITSNAVIAAIQNASEKVKNAVRQ